MGTRKDRYEARSVLLMLLAYSLNSVKRRMKGGRIMLAAYLLGSFHRDAVKSRRPKHLQQSVCLF